MAKKPEHKQQKQYWNKLNKNFQMIYVKKKSLKHFKDLFQTVMQFDTNINHFLKYMKKALTNNVKFYLSPVLLENINGEEISPILLCSRK